MGSKERYDSIHNKLEDAFRVAAMKAETDVGLAG